MTKYKQAVEEMIAGNADLFAHFQTLKYESPNFHEVGKQVLSIVEKTENLLCGKMEGSGHSHYSGNLAEKFRAEVRSHCPLVDLVGVKLE